MCLESVKKAEQVDDIKSKGQNPQWCIKRWNKNIFIKQHKWKIIYSPATLRFVVIFHASFLRCQQQRRRTAHHEVMTWKATIV